MFRIESYITPIILSHIEKYVRNIRPQDAQLSLWNGEWAFQNLDLRLDVLEEELNLPFIFLSGHIHELIIRVPWTKIASEPVTITINTIEFVVKLKDPDAGSATPAREKVKKKPVKDEEVQAPPGYVASLVNKIANNISVQCHNIIFKYLEEDIVVSMNIQLLSVDSADSEWNPTFIDISPTKVLLRKIVRISDLTICLDKRNETGIIDVCQEPILYKCSMEMRFLRRYNISTLHKSSVVRVDVHTDCIDLNISSLQFPMVMRLLNLMLVLKQGKLRAKLGGSASAESNQDADQSDENGESIFSWAWNLLPSIFPDEELSEGGEENHGHVFHCGTYVNKLKVTFKNQEIINDSIVHTTKKIKYKPMLTIELTGCYSDTILVGNRWFSMTGGCSAIEIFPIGDCVCGQRQLLTGFIATEQGMGTNYLEGSLKDPTADENLDIYKTYNMLWDYYYLKHTEKSLLAKTPGLAFDMVHTVEIPDDIARSSDIGSDLEFSDLSEKCLYRAFVGPLTVRYGTGFSHLVDTFKNYVNLYNYTPYVEEKPPLTLAQLSPASTDDYDALMSEIPFRVFEVTVQKPILEFYTRDHEKLPKIGKKKYSLPQRLDSLPLGLAIEPNFTLHAERIEAKTVSPMYPNRLVHTTCQLPDPPAKLFTACYTKIEAEAKRIEIVLRKGESRKKVIEIPEVICAYSDLLLPELWEKDDIFHTIAEMSIKKLKMEFNRLQELFFRTSIRDLLMTETGQMDASEELFDSNLPQISLELDGITATINKTRCTSVFTGNLSSVTASICIPGISHESPVIAQHEKEHFASMVLQISHNPSRVVHQPILSFQISGVVVNFDPLLFEFFTHKYSNKHQDLSSSSKFDALFPPISDTPKKTISEKILKRPPPKVLETVHSSSEKNTTIVFTKRKDIPKKQVSLVEIYSLWKNLVIAGEVKSSKIVFPRVSLKKEKDEETIMDILRRRDNFEIVILQFPRLAVQSTGNKIPFPLLRENFPIALQWDREKDTFPWSLVLAEFSCSVMENGEEYVCLAPARTNISLAITYKTPELDKVESPFAVVFHIDIAPLIFRISESQVKLLVSTLRNFLSLPMIANLMKMEENPGNNLEIAQRPISPETDVDIKEFLGMKTTSTHDMSSDTTEVLRDDRAISKISVWLQWTLTRLTLKFYNTAPDGVKQKFELELEDIISSVDLRDIYVKLKAKIGSFVGSSFLLDESKTWRKNPLMGICGRATESSDPNDTFLDLTVTKAETGSVHTKWGTSRKNRNLNESLTEVMLNMQQIDMKVDLDSLHSLVDVLKTLLRSESGTNDAGVRSVDSMPLIYFQSKGFRIFVPIENDTENCNVYILKVGQVSVAPAVENPLSRMPVRPDIYTKAAQLRILNIPGSKIEDRQYELMLKSITIGTGNWGEVIGLMEGTSKGSIVYNENPAFVWNNQANKAAVDISAIFKDFNCSLVFAPCIVFNNILVCGQGVEFNSLTDLILHLNTNQVRVGLILLQKLKTLGEAFAMPSKREECLRKKAAVKISLKSSKLKRVHEKPESDIKDSGFESIEVDKKSTTETIKEKAISKAVIPYDLSFVGGVFTINLYHQQSPLTTVSVFQPNLFITQGVYEKTIQMSVFDMKLALFREQEKDEFSEVIFHTSKGELDAMGIPPSIFKVRLHQNISNECNLTIQLGRHMKVSVSDKSLRKILEVRTVMQDIMDCDFFAKSNPDQRISTMRKPANAIKFIKSSFLGCDSLLLTLSHLELSAKAESEEIKAVAKDFSVKVKLFERPSRVQLDVVLKVLTIITGEHTFLHPMSFIFNTSLIREVWQKTPVCTCHFSTKYVQLDVGPENFLILQKIKESLLECSKGFGIVDGDNEASSEISQPTDADLENITPIKLPKFSGKDDGRVSEEHYRDDLRAGAFQFIEVHQSDDNLPLPYQIQIINRDVGIICWRYPQPRALKKVDVFPVPFPTLSPVEIRCTMEYYSEAHGHFLHHCEFTLSESEMKTLEMPRARITASIWRVVMSSPMVSVDGTFFEEESSSAEEESLLTNREPFIYNINDILQRVETDKPGNASVFNLHPKILVACLRIDSVFNPALIANLRGCIDIAQIEINLMNHISRRPVKIPSVIKGFNPTGSITPCHSVGLLRILNAKAHVNIFDEWNLSLGVDLMAELCILDYSYLISYPVIENARISAAIEKDCDAVAINVLSEPIRVRFGPSVGHALATTHSLWTLSLQNSQEPMEMILVTRFLICNATNIPLIFGQTETDERISLPAKVCHFYVFRSEKKEQMITFTVDCWIDPPLQSEACEISREGTKSVKLSNGGVLIVVIEKISATQRKITLKGQMEVFNMSTEAVVVQFRSPENLTDILLPGRKSSSALNIFPHGELPHSLRMRLNQEGWSGEIPLKETGKNLPWLVKVPYKSSFVSFWLRIIREEQHPRIIIVVWPLFVLKSNLGISSTIYEAKCDKSFSIPGRGAVSELSFPGTHEDEHNLQFNAKFVSAHGEDRRDVMLSYRAIEKNMIFQGVNQGDFDKMIESLENCLVEPKSSWPCAREEELLWERKVKNQGATIPIYKFSASHPNSNCLMLEVSSWCLFINSTEFETKLTSWDDKQSTTARSNDVTMLFGSSEPIKMNLSMESCSISLPPVSFSASDKKVTQSIILPDAGSLPMEVGFECGICKVQLTSVQDNSSRVVILSSHFIVSNFTGYDLRIWAFAIQNQDRKTLIKPNDAVNVGNYTIPPQSGQHSKGVALTAFYDLSPKRKKPAKSYNYFLAIRCSEDGEFSCPVHLNEAINCKSVSLPKDNNYIPLRISLIKRQDQSFITIHEDPYPRMWIENFTEYSVYVAQADSVTVGKTPVAVRECFDQHFSWYQIVPFNTKIPYTPPLVDRAFPDDSPSDFGLIFALVTAGTTIRWSVPMLVNERKHVFLTIPLCGDLKVSVDTRWKSTRIFIDYISANLEFSARDIRSRLLNPTRAPEVPDVMSQDKVISTRKSLQEEVAVTSLSCNVLVKEINLVLYYDQEEGNALKNELISISVDNLVVRFENKTPRMKIGIGNIQVDNQLHFAGKFDFPVVLCAEKPQNSLKNVSSPLTLQSNLASGQNEFLCEVSVDFYEREFVMRAIHCHMNPIKAYIEDTYMNALLDFLVECLPTNIVYKTPTEIVRETCPRGIVILPNEIVNHAVRLAKPLQLESLRIDIVHVLLSVHTCVRFYIALDHSPLVFSAFERKNINTQMMRLGYSLGMHYLSGAIFGAGWVVGSLEILGSPSGLARSVSTGLRDFVSLPVEGLFRGPWDFLVGVTLGSASLVKNITAGTLNSVTKLATSVARNLDRLTLDEEHLQRTDALRRYRPQGLTQGFAQGLTDFGISLLGAIGGIARHTLEAKSATEVFTGVGKGLMGVILKPISGAAELVALTGQGVLHSVGYNALPNCRSPGCLINMSGTPTSTKIAWKVLPPTFANDATLFSVHITLITSDHGLRATLLTVSTKIVTLLDVAQDELIQIIPMEKIQMEIDENDATIVILKIVAKASKKADDDASMNQYPVHSRVREYIQRSREQLPVYSDQASIHSVEETDEDREANAESLSFYIHSHLGQHLVSYVNFLRTIQS
ncbi:intermembrane lipid transfer protein VPS13B [Phlebotomus argentipes]|uniref:intermembrane lipid transfer protein VPS13B n=1 Tax=Phlebotomus argentipes TaxID=94469 RepID=UPI0028937A45|nr:intermembrane lipid transfer protein VPS13B [Phlebotomus argentipes]